MTENYAKNSLNYELIMNKLCKVLVLYNEFQNCKWAI